MRDRDATLHLERRYKADNKGAAIIELVGKPTVMVVVYGDVLLTTELDPHDLNPLYPAGETLGTFHGECDCAPSPVPRSRLIVHWGTKTPLVGDPV